MSEVGNIEISLVLNGVDSFDKNVNNAANSLGKISISLDSYSNRLKSAESSSQSFLSKMRDYTIVFGGVHRAITMATDAITSIPRSIIENNASIERNKVLLAGLEKGVGSYAEAQNKAGEEMKEVLSVSKGMPYSIDAILDSYTKLRVGGVQNTTEALEALLNTAAKSGATSEQLKHASVAIQQMAGKGVISMEELRGQLGEAIPDAMNIMSRAVGMDMATMVKVISTGSLESKSALARFFHEMKLENDGAAYQMSTTWTGIVSQIQKSWEVLVTNNSQGSDLFTNLKGQLRELNTALGTNEAKRFMQDLDSALSKFVTSATSAAKFAYENITVISSALIGMFATSKLSGPVSNFVSTIRNGYSGIIEKNNEVKTHFQTMIDSVNQEKAKAIQKHNEFVANNNNGSKAMMDFERNVHNEWMRMYNARIQNLQQLQASQIRVTTLSSSMNVLKTAVSGVADAFGGWSTIAITAIASVIAYTVQAINKQKELQHNLTINNGFGATQEEMLAAKRNLDDYDNAKRALEAAQSAYNDRLNGKVGGLGTTDDLRLQVEHWQRVVAIKEKSHAADVEHYKNAREANDLAEKELGSARFQQQVESKLGQLQLQRTAQYDAEIEKNKNIKDLKERMRANDEASAKKTKDLTDGQLNILNTQLKEYSGELERFTKSLGPNGKDLDLSKMTDEQRRQFNTINGLLDKTRAKISEVKSAANFHVPEINLLNQGTKKQKESKDTGQSFDDGIDVQIAKLKEKLAALNENRDAETKSAELEARIANGDFKGKSDEFVSGLRAKAKEYDTLNAAVSNYKETAAQVTKIEDGLKNQVMSLTKKAAKSDIDANNPFLQWARSTEGEKEALNERIKQLQDLNSYSDESRERARQAAELIAQIDQNNAHDMITEKDKELTKALMSTRKAAEFQHQEELNQLAAFEEAVMKMQESPAKQKMLAQIDLVKKKMEAVYDREHDPFKKWLASSEDLADGVNNKLVSTFDGLFDGIAERIVDTTANFGDMVRSLADDLQKYVIKLLMINALKSAIMGTSYGESLSGFFGGSSGGGGAAVAQTGYSTNFTDVSQPFQPTQFTGFANGGIMTPYGSIPLKKYAKGGVATSPQVAVFAEAGMNEAYVPLPDGRTIPVTMTGGRQAASNIGVSVNVINQSGIQMDAEQSAPRFDGESYIIDVVLNAVSRPGRMRTAIKGIK